MLCLDDVAHWKHVILRCPGSRYSSLRLPQVLKIARDFGAEAICNSNRKSKITNDLKASALRFDCCLRGGLNHKLCDSEVALKPFAAVAGGRRGWKRSREENPPEKIHPN